MITNWLGEVVEPFEGESYSAFVRDDYCIEDRLIVGKCRCIEFQIRQNLGIER